jgi:hypothetical protein
MQYKFLVFSNPTEGRDDDYNEWYTNVHLAEVTAIPGFTGAQRFRLVPGEGPQPEHRYLAVYDIETDNIQGVLQELFVRGTEGRMQMSDAIDQQVTTYLYETLPAAGK